MIIRKEVVKIKEDLFEEHPSANNRIVVQKAQFELTQYFHYEKRNIEDKRQGYSDLLKGIIILNFS